MDHLEDIIDTALVPNDTFIFGLNATGTTESVFERFHGTCLLFADWIGIIADIIIVCAISNNSRMRNRRNLILLNWAIFDMLYLSDLIGFVIEIVQVFQQKSTFTTYDYCLMIHTHLVFKFSSSFMILLLMSTIILRTTAIRDGLVIGAGYAFCLIILLVNFIVCIYFFSEIIYLCYLLLMLTQLVALIGKEINICYKARRDDPVSDKTRIIINIARIFVYNHLFIMIYFGVEYDLSHTVGIILSYMELSIPLTSVYILIYLLRADLNFRNCVKNMCCCGSANELDATVTYTDNTAPDQVNVDFARIQDDR